MDSRLFSMAADQKVPKTPDDNSERRAMYFLRTKKTIHFTYIQPILTLIVEKVVRIILFHHLSAPNIVHHQGNHHFGQ